MTTPDQTTPNGAPSTPQALALTPQQSRAIELREGIGPGEPRAIIPTTFAEAQSFAGALAHSSLIPDALRERSPDILMTILAGAELAIPPVRALTLFHVIEGVPKLSADGIAAVCVRSPVCEYLEPREQSADRVTWATKRRGRPEVIMSYSMGEAVLAGLVRATRSGAPGNWQKFPRNMMNARCKADLCRMVYPDLCAGLVTAEEQRDYIDVDPDGGKSTGFVAPIAPTSSAPVGVITQPTTAPAPTKRGPGRPPNASRPIDASSTETPPPGAVPSGSTSAAPTTSPTVSSTGSGGLPADPARDAALAKAAENAKTLDETRRDPTTSSSAPPPSSDPAPANSGQGAPPSSSATGPASSSASAADDADGFGGSDAPHAETARTIERFEADVRACVEAKRPDALENVKRDWVSWSKDETPTGGKQHAHRMRDVFAKAKADLGIR